MKKTLLLLLAIMATGFLGGCQMLYFVAPDPPPKYKEAEFAGLANRSLAIVISADPDVLFEYPRMRLDLAGRLGGELRQNVSGLRLVDPRTVVKFQDENLDWDTLDKTRLGKDLGADYVMYIAMSRYTMKEEGSEYLYRGEIICDVTVHQVSLPERQSRVYRQNGFKVVHPPEAVPADNDNLVRAVADSRFATTLAKKFYKHKVED